MRVVVLRDKMTIEEGGRWPYRFENVHYFGVDNNGSYVVVHGIGTIYTDVVVNADADIVSFSDCEEDE